MSLLTLARWLGPWASEDARPAIEPEAITHPAEEDPLFGPRPAFEVWRYAPPRPRGTWLIAPGLHYAGPRDPRMDRFCRVLAAAGCEVLCPFLPDYTALRVHATAIADFARLADTLRDKRPAVFSVSFGSLLALRLAADPARRDFLSGLALFGGYADFRAVVRFALEGAPGRPHDPLNRPVVVLNCLEHLDHGATDLESVTAAWDRYVRRTWGRPEMKADAAWQAVAREEGASLSGAERELYELGTGLSPGALEACLAAIDRGDFSHLDPRPHLAGARGPIHVLHGAEDDVIPFEQAEVIARALPGDVPRQVLVTGLYGHTGGAAVSPRSAIRELSTMFRMLRTMSQLPRQGRE